MIPDGGIATVGKRAGAPVADARRVVGIPAEYPCCNPAKTQAPPSEHHKLLKQ